MARINDVLEKLAASLRTVPELANVGVIVDRYQDIDSEAKKAIAQRTAAAILAHTGGDLPEERHVNVDATFTCTLVFKPVVSDKTTQYLPDDMLEATIRHIHTLKLGPDVLFCPGQFQVTDYQLIDNPQVVIWVLTIENQVML